MHLVSFAESPQRIQLLTKCKQLKQNSTSQRRKNMSKNTNDLLVDDLGKARLSGNENKSLLPSSLQNPFSLAWSKFANLISATLGNKSETSENSQQEQHEPDEIRMHQFYSRFTDRVDPSLYYTIFSPYDRF
jgi:hypothetical protein